MGGNAGLWNSADKGAALTKLFRLCKSKHLCACASEDDGWGLRRVVGWGRFGWCRCSVLGRRLIIRCIVASSCSFISDIYFEPPAPRRPTTAPEGQDSNKNAQKARALPLLPGTRPTARQQLAHEVGPCKCPNSAHEYGSYIAPTNNNIRSICVLTILMHAMQPSF